MAETTNKENREIEAKFLEADIPALKKRLSELGAKDAGEHLIKQIVFDDAKGEWPEALKLVRVREMNGKTTLAYKHQKEATIDGTEEIEFEISSAEKATIFLEKLGLVAFRRIEKLRHHFVLDSVDIDIDTYPNLPSIVEVEAKSESEVKTMVERLGLNWGDARFENPAIILEEQYNIPVRKLHFFTFDKTE